MPPRILPSCVALSAFLLAACGGDQVTTYAVPKEKDPEPPAAAADAGAPADQAPGPAMAGTAVPTASGADLSWEAPAAWAKKAAGPMRKASFAVPSDAGECELSITAFPGDVGGELANVNRWRGQAGLSPLGPAALESAVTRLDANGLKVAVVEITAGDPAGKSILGAIVPFEGSTWFFKLTGPAAGLKASQPAFLGFLRTVKAP